MEQIIITAKDESMTPYFFTGDKIACIKVGIDTLKWHGGEVYYIELKNGLTALRRVYEDGDKITIKVYKDDSYTQTLPKDYILDVYKVIASARVY